MSMLTRFAALGGAAAAAAQTYVDDVFSTYLYTGNGSTQTITNGINLSGNGGMVWFKERSSSPAPSLFDTERGRTKVVFSNGTQAQLTNPTTDGITSFNSNGFSLGPSFYGGTNLNNSPIVSWTFRKAAKFFDVVTWTGNGTANREISHSLGVAPGVVVVKRIDAADSWYVWHRSAGAGFPDANNLFLETTGAQAQASNAIKASATPSTTFVAGDSASPNNVNTATYVAYLFAHDTGTDGLMQCGSFTTDGSGNATVTGLGWEPQFLMVKASSTTGDWIMLDNVRGWDLGSIDGLLRANLANAETSSTNYGNPTSDGFSFSGGSASATYIYMAIRRSNKPPTAGTSVFQPTVYTGTNVDNRLVDTTIAPDMVWVRQRDDTVLSGLVVGDRLRGQPYLLTGSTAAEVDDANSFDRQLVSATEYGSAFSAMNGFYCGNDATAKLNVNTTASNHIAEAFKRAAGFFDVVCYTGNNSSPNNVTHNLGVSPELIIAKARGVAQAGYDVWCVGGIATYLALNSSGARFTAGSSTRTATTFDANTVRSDGNYPANRSNEKYVAYLFATLAGISKVGTYTGNGGTVNTNGTSQTINCGFSAGARFVLIKRTDSTGDWFVFDSARGIVAASDPYLWTDSNIAEVASADIIDPDNSGFVINQTGTHNLNVTSATYIYLAIA